MLKYTEHDEPSTIVFELGGNLSYDDYDMFSKILNKLKALKNKDIIFDLSNLDSISSDGLSLFIMSQEFSKVYDYRLHFKNPIKQRVAKFFKTMHLHQYFDVIGAT